MAMSAMSHKIERPICSKYGFFSKLRWAARNLNRDLTHQYDIIQVLEQGETSPSFHDIAHDANWECANPNEKLNIKELQICWNKNIHALAVVADEGDIVVHSEELALQYMRKIRRNGDENRILVIISTKAPCGSCSEQKKLEKICNGGITAKKIEVDQHENRPWEKHYGNVLRRIWINQPNPSARYSQCIFLWSMKYKTTRKYWQGEIREFYEKPTPDPWEFAECKPKQGNVQDEIEEIKRSIKFGLHRKPDTKISRPQKHQLQPPPKHRPGSRDVKRSHHTSTTTHDSARHASRSRSRDQGRDKSNLKNANDRSHRDKISAQMQSRRDNKNGKEKYGKEKYGNKDMERKRKYKANMEYFNPQFDDTTKQSQEYMAYSDFLYVDGIGNGYGDSDHQQISNGLNINHDEYLFTVAGILFGIFAICLAMICSYIYGVITGVMGRNMIKEKDADIDSDLDV